jgi:hypothetical protein
MADSAPKVAEVERVEEADVIDQKASRLADQIRGSARDPAINQL